MWVTLPRNIASSAIPSPAQSMEILVVKGNQNRLLRIAENLKRAVTEDVNAQTGLYVIIQAQRELLEVASDLHFRPEVNS